MNYSRSQTPDQREPCKCVRKRSMPRGIGPSWRFRLVRIAYTV
jgi:hypothetical protein